MQKRIQCRILCELNEFHNTIWELISVLKKEYQHITEDNLVNVLSIELHSLHNRKLIIFVQHGEELTNLYPMPNFIRKNMFNYDLYQWKDDVQIHITIAGKEYFKIECNYDFFSGS